MMGGLYRSWKDETGGKRYSFMGYENYSSGWKAHEPSAGQDRPQSTVDIGAHREDRTMKPNPNPAAGEIKESRRSGVSINIGNHRISGKGRGEDKS